MISLADLQAYIGAADVGVDEEAVLTDLEVRAVALVEKATGRFFGASASYTYYLEGGGGLSLYLPDEVTAVASISYRENLSEAFADLDSDQWERNGTELLRVDGLEWPYGRSTVKVVATRGYAADAEPGAIRQLVMDLVNWQYRAGRKLALEDVGSPDVAAVKGWDRVIGMFRGPMYG